MVGRTLTSELLGELALLGFGYPHLGCHLGEGGRAKGEEFRLGSGLGLGLGLGLGVRVQGLGSGSGSGLGSRVRVRVRC